MAQVSARRDPITNELFQFLYFRKPAHFGTGPERIAVNANFENAANSRKQRKLADLARKRGEKFLCHPRCPQQPPALGAVFDFDARSFRHHCSSVAFGNIARHS